MYQHSKILKQFARVGRILTLPALNDSNYDLEVVPKGSNKPSEDNM